MKIVVLVFLMMFMILSEQRKHQMREQGIEIHDGASPPTSKPINSSVQQPTQSNQNNNSTSLNNGPTKEQLQAANPARNLWQRLFGQLDSFQITAVMIVITSILII